MKKIFLLALLVLSLSFRADAQTEFRHITFDEAKTAAKAEGKFIFIDFFTTWCGPCKRLASNVFPTKQVGDYLNGKYVCLKIDAEKGEGVELAKKYGVAAYPTLAVINADGELLGSFAGLKEGDEFIAAVEMCNNPELKPERVKARYEAGERNTPLVVAYATLLADNNRDYKAGLNQAKTILDEYFNTLSDKDRLAKENNGLFTTFAYDYDNPRMRFLIDRRAEFVSDNGSQLDETIKGAFDNEVNRYFSSNLLRDNEENMKAYNLFKQEAAKLGFVGEFGRKLEFAEKRASSDDATFLDFCNKNFMSLAEDEQATFAYSLSNIFPTETPEQKKALSSFLRNHIASLKPNALYIVASAIMSLESTPH